MRDRIDRPDQALPDCEKAVSLNPRHRDALTNLGVVYGALNRPAEAEASYRRALDIEPSNAHVPDGTIPRLNPVVLLNVERAQLRLNRMARRVPWWAILAATFEPVTGQAVSTSHVAAFFVGTSTVLTVVGTVLALAICVQASAKVGPSPALLGRLMRIRAATAPRP